MASNWTPYNNFSCNWNSEVDIEATWDETWPSVLPFPLATAVSGGETIQNFETFFKFGFFFTSKGTLETI